MKLSRLTDCIVVIGAILMLIGLVFGNAADVAAILLIALPIWLFNVAILYGDWE